MPVSCQENLFCGVNTIKDCNNMSDLEKKHLPVITAPKKVKKDQCFEVTVEVGKLMDHPNIPAHFIEFIDLYADDTFITRMDLTATRTCPIMKACISLDHIHSSLKAYERCNLHGTWMSETAIEVTNG